MELIEAWLILSVVVAVGYIVIVFQTFALAQLLASRGWYGLATGWTLLGGLRVWNLIRLPVNLMKAQAQGYQIPTHMTFEQKSQIFMGLLAISVIILSLDKMRRDFRQKFGV